jgi:predicted nucleic-acid-binding protein
MAKSPDFLPDTNVVLRYLMKDVAEQFQLAAAFFEEVRTGKKSVLLLESVLVECLYILTKFYKVPKREAAEVLGGLLQYKGVVNKDKPALSAALAMHIETNLDMVDCVLIAQAQHRSAQFFSFDKSLNKKAVKSVPADIH